MSATGSKPSSISEPFERSAAYYDCIYADKDYAGEIAKIMACLDQPQSRKRVIEVGAGTGRYGEVIRALGHSYLGVEPCRQMREQAEARGLAMVAGGIEDWACLEQADLTLCLFNVLGYICHQHPLRYAFNCLRAATVPGGVLAFDYVSYAAALRHLNKDDVRIVPIPGGTLTRTTERDLLWMSGTLEHRVTFETSTGERWRETHYVRTCTPMEIAEALRDCGFDKLYSVNGDNNRSTWSITQLAW